MFYFFIRGNEVMPLLTTNEALVRAKAEEYKGYIFFAANLNTDEI